MRYTGVDRPAVIDALRVFGWLAIIAAGVLLLIA